MHTTFHFPVATADGTELQEVPRARLWPEHLPLPSPMDRLSLWIGGVQMQYQVAHREISLDISGKRPRCRIYLRPWVTDER